MMPSKRLRAPSALGLVMMAACCLAPPLKAQDLAPILGPLAAKVVPGSAGAWQVSSANGQVILEDSGDPGSIRQYSIPWQGDVAAGRSVGAIVQVSGDGAAGLVFGVNTAGDPRWYAVLVDGGNHVRLVKRSQAGVDELARVDIPAGQASGGVKLQISEQDKTLSLYIDGESFATINREDTLLVQAPTGIIAFGPGRFAFSQYAFGPAITAAADNGDDHLPGAAPGSGGGDDHLPQPGIGGGNPLVPPSPMPPPTPPAPEPPAVPLPPPPVPQPPTVPPPSPDSGYADELTDFGVPPQSQLQSNVGTPTPLQIPGAKRVTTEQLQHEANGGLLLIDALASPHQQTLPNTVWLPGAGSGGSFNDRTEAQLAAILSTLTQNNPNTPIVFFCLGAHCWESYNAVLRAEHLGYHQLYWYRGGLQSWQAANLPLAPPIGTKALQ